MRYRIKKELWKGSICHIQQGEIQRRLCFWSGVQKGAKCGRISDKGKTHGKGGMGFFP